MRNMMENIDEICKFSSLHRINNSNIYLMIVSFKKIDSPEKAYLLGWIASDGSIRYFGFIIKFHKKDLKILEKLRDIICKDLPINEYRENMV